MRRVRRVLGVVGIFISLASALLLAQSAVFAILSAGPTGEIRQLEEANEIRIVFSEPMVALGRIPANPTPAWVRIAPAIKGQWRWSGTTILIFTPDPATPLHYATRYTVTVDATATSVAGRPLAKPYQFSFTTPTVRLESARWTRQGSRFDTPVQLALSFNQQVRAADVLAHVAARFEPHPVELPAFAPAERASLASSDPEGLKRFDAKIALARQTAARRDPVTLRLATAWDRKRFPPGDAIVVLETVAAPPPGAFLHLTMDARMPSPDGPALPPTAQTTTVELPKLFFVTGPRCRSECTPSAYNFVAFTEQADAASFARALTATDVTESAQGKPVPKSSRVIEANRDTGPMYSVEDAGFDRQPPARTWALRLDAGFTATDGQTLGYPWLGFVENWHETAFTGFGDGHGVWETSGGTRLPFYSRNLRTVTEYVQKLSLADLMPSVRALENIQFALLPFGLGSTRRLDVTPDEIQSHGLELKSSLSPQGTGLFWAAMKGGEALPRTKIVERTCSTVIQATNLGITVKDSPHSTLVFVTRLDNGQPVPRRARHHHQHREQAALAGDERRAGPGLVAGLAAAQAERAVSVFISRDRRERRRRRVRRLELERRDSSLGLRLFLPVVGSDGRPARLHLHGSWGLQARRAGAGEGDPPRRHVERRPAASGRHQSRRHRARQPLT